MTSKRRAFTKEFKQEAVELTQATGRPVREIERNLGLPRGILYRWRRELARSKTELLAEGDRETRQKVKAAIFAYIETFYNRQRRHSALNYLAPDEFERRYHVASE